MKTHIDTLAAVGFVGGFVGLVSGVAAWITAFLVLPIVLIASFSGGVAGIFCSLFSLSDRSIRATGFAVGLLALCAASWVTGEYLVLQQGKSRWPSAYTDVRDNSRLIDLQD